MKNKEETKSKVLISKIKEYKTEIIVVGGAVLATTALIVLQKKGIINLSGINVFDEIKSEKNNKRISSETDNITKIAKHPISPEIGRDNSQIARIMEPLKIERHIRKLPNGHKPSAEKITLALNNGIQLQDGETVVNEHFRYCA